MNTEQIRAEFEAWAKERGMTLHKASPCDGSSPYYLDTASIAAWEAYQAGRAALQSQPMPPEISRDLLGKIVDEVFDGAIEDASVIEDIYRVVARECALQSQDREDAERWRWLRDRSNSLETAQRDKGMHIGRSCYHTVGGIRELKWGDELDAAIDAARRIEGDCR